LKIAVIGAGAMGTLFGVHLARGGHVVAMIDVSQPVVDAINRDGLRLQTDAFDERVRVRVRAGSAAAFTEAFDLVIVFTKSMHTAAAVEAAAHLIGAQTYVLTAQNGIGNVEAVAGRVAPQHIVRGMTNLPADLKGPGHAASHGTGEIRIYSAVAMRDARVDAIAETLSQAGLPCRVDPMVEVAVWEKVAFNAALNATAAITRLTVGALGRRPEGRELAAAVVAETLHIARRRGLAVDEQHVMATVAHAFAHHGGHKPSMLQDLLQQRETEIDFINGAVIAEAERLGLEAPINWTLHRLVKLLERRERIEPEAGDTVSG
jgi:2-dehydropantoate 2-reductase